MGKVTGFLEIDRQERKFLPAGDRMRNYAEFVIPLDDPSLKRQAARCMDCGIPHCQSGCPVDNQIPDWNDLVYNSDWEEAARNLHSTNNFPEITGRICPAPCEEACVLNIDNVPVTIKTIECAIADKALANGWVTPQPPETRTGRRVAIVGSGPAGMAAAQQLARAGHDVHVYEKHAHPGGLLRYGIPDFKMEKHMIDVRAEQMQAEGVTFHMGVHIGVDLPAGDLEKNHDAVLLAGGAEHSRDLPIEGRALEGVHFAMEFLPQQNRHVSGEPQGDVEPISASGKHVIVIGGGDTGSDCIGTSFRQGALSVTQLEILVKPPEQEDKPLIWPHWPLKLRTSSSQAEGAERDWSVMTTRFEGRAGKLERLCCVRVDERMKPVKGSAFELEAELVLLAMGFVHPVHEGMIEKLKLKLDERGNVLADESSYRTSRKKVFAAGDMRRGQSLVVWAIREGRQAAHTIDALLMGASDLPR